MDSPLPIRGIPYANPVRPWSRLEAIPVEALRQRASQAHFRKPRRPDFHHLCLFTAGRGSHAVDFQWMPLSEGVVIHAGPGQVHAFDWEPDLQGTVLMFAPDVLEARWLAPEHPWPCRIDLEPDERPEIAQAFEGLRMAYLRSEDNPLGERLLSHLLAALILRLKQVALQHPSTEDPAHPISPLVRYFEEEIERSHLHTRKVADYARRLGYSERTLSRLLLAAGRTSPKAMINARVILEARRLLVHSELSIQRIACHLGFSESTNFSKFFRRETGTTPEAFRQALDRTGSPRVPW